MGSRHGAILDCGVGSVFRNDRREGRPRTKRLSARQNLGHGRAELA